MLKSKIFTVVVYYSVEHCVKQISMYPYYNFKNLEDHGYRSKVQIAI